MQEMICEKAQPETPKEEPMTTQLRDPQFADFVEALAESIPLPEMGLRFDVFEVTAGAAAALYEAFATPERGFVANAFKGLAI